MVPSTYGSVLETLRFVPAAFSQVIYDFLTSAFGMVVKNSVKMTLLGQVRGHSNSLIVSDR